MVDGPIHNPAQFVLVGVRSSAIDPASDGDAAASRQALAHEWNLLWASDSPPLNSDNPPGIDPASKPQRAIQIADSDGADKANADVRARPWKASLTVQFDRQRAKRRMEGYL